MVSQAGRRKGQGERLTVRRDDGGLCPPRRLDHEAAGTVRYCQYVSSYSEASDSLAHDGALRRVGKEQEGNHPRVPESLILSRVLGTTAYGMI